MSRNDSAYVIIVAFGLCGMVHLAICARGAEPGLGALSSPNGHTASARGGSNASAPQLTVGDVIPLVPGANQWVELASWKNACLDGGALRSGERGWLRDGDLSIMFEVGNPTSVSDERTWLHIPSVPRDLRPGTNEFDLVLDGPTSCTVAVTMAEPISVEPDIEVHYKIPELEHLHDHQSKDRIAVAEPHDREFDGQCHIVNVAKVTGLARLITPVASTDHKWILKPHDGRHILIPQCSSDGDAGSPSNTEGCKLGDPTRIAFTMRETRQSPIVVDLILQDCGPPRDGGSAADAAGGPQCYEVLTIPLTVANSARIESVPMPIANAITVDCGDPDAGARNGDTIAIRDDDLQTGKCHATIEFKKVPGHAADYGPQALHVTVTCPNCGNPEKTLWRVDPSSCPAGNRKVDSCVLSGGADPCVRDGGLDAGARPGEPDAGTSASEPGTCRGCECSVHLPAPEARVGGGGVYTVDISNPSRLSGPTYRSGSGSDIATEDLVSPDLTFTARLRSRGPYGWPDPFRIRTYITVPINIAGIRFPANPRDLHSSTESVRYAFVKPRAGVLLVLEHWNYVTGKNDWPLAPGLQWGFQAYESSEQLGLSHVVGIGFTLPLLSRDQLSFDLTAVLSALWERDLRARSGEQVDFLLVTAGFNLFSFLSGH